MATLRPRSSLLHTFILLASSTLGPALLGACAYGLDPSLPEDPGDDDRTGMRSDGGSSAPSTPRGLEDARASDGRTPGHDSGNVDAATREAGFVEAGSRDSEIVENPARDGGIVDAAASDAGRDAARDGDASVPAVDASGPVLGAAEGCLLLSEVLESNANRRAVEVWNRCGAPVPVASLRFCLETNSHVDECHEDTAFGGAPFLPAHGVRVVCHPNFGDPRCDDVNDAVDFNGDDRFALFVDADGDGRIDRGVDRIVDTFGRLGFAPPSGVVPAVGRPWEDGSFRRISCAPFRATATFVTSSSYATFSSSDLTNLGVAPSLACP
ncbi:MAG: hypothetical protein U0169_14995 [Polyangiaceae bacterium]